MRYIKKFHLLFLFFFILFTTSCLSEKHTFERPTVSFIPDFYLWNIVSDEIAYADIYLPDFPLIYHLVRIDLSSPKIQLCEFHENGNYPGKDRAVMITDLNKNLEPIVLTNTSPFQYSNRLALKFSWMPSTYKCVGIHMENGKIKSEPVDKYCALAFYRDGESLKAEIFDSQGDENLLCADYAFGGFYTILRDYEIRSFPANNYDSRNGAGLSADGKTLYLLAVEGEFQGRSIGLPYPDCAEIFLKLGCKDAMQFDGGGTTCLFVDGQNLLTYKPFRKSPAFMGFTLTDYPAEPAASSQ